MKRMMVTAILGLLISNVQAKNILHCKTDFSELIVYDVLDGYEFLVEAQGYSRRESIFRNTVDNKPDGHPAMTFYNERVRIVHLFGEYTYFSSEGFLEFPDEGCVRNP